MQMKAFGEAEIIVGPHGAGFANILFAKPETTLIEFLPESASYKTALFGELTALSDCHHAVLICEDELNPRYPLHPGNQHMSVNCAALRDLLTLFTRKSGLRNTAGRRVLDVHLQGGFAERMMQYMTARHIAERVGECLLSDAVLPEWGIEHAVLAGEGDESGIGVSGERVDVDGIATTLQVGIKTRIGLRSCAQWFSNFPDVEKCRGFFPAQEHEYPGFGPEYLVANIQLPVNGNADQVLLPIEFYAELAESTGLRLAFLGQLEENAYCRALRERFPDAVFQKSGRAMADFHVFRNSCNLVPAVTAFSWLRLGFRVPRRSF
jgi:hypothetical protein